MSATATQQTRQRMIEAAVIRHTDEIKSDTARELLYRINLCRTSDGAFSALLAVHRTPTAYSDETGPRPGQVSYQEKLSLEYLAHNKRRRLQSDEMWEPCPDCGGRASCGC
jgi:hypothetical protein